MVYECYIFMPTKGNTPQTVSCRTKKSFKRKAVSPVQVQVSDVNTAILSTDLLCAGVLDSQNSQTCSVYNNNQDTSCKRLQQSSPEQFCFESHAGYKSTDSQNIFYNMSYPQTPFGGGFMQSMQSPPFVPQFATASTTPPWAKEIIEDLKSIKISVSKIDKIEKMINKMNTKIETLETKVKNTDSRMTEVEQSTQYISNEFEETKKKLHSASVDINKLSTKCTDFEETINKLESQNVLLEEKANDLEARSMRENLLFHGIKETTGEDCEQLIKTFIKDRLEIEHIATLDRIHRLGKPKATGPRPIVAKFHYYRERELVRTTAITKSVSLRAEHQSVGIQQTKAVLQKRRSMFPVMDKARAAGQTVRWAGAKVMVMDKGGSFKEVTH